ncbi:hypothetical protein CSPX01_01166 [Colletotrichum filicis]|nr:hypothetical protein CSPX01_01166 [Colletotrichum filicis]
MANENDEEQVLPENQEASNTQTDNNVAEAEDNSATRGGEMPLLVKLGMLWTDEAAEKYLNSQGETWKIEVNKRSLQHPKQTPLHIAVEKKFLRTARLLLEAGADFMALDDNLRQPLHLACRGGSNELAKLLIEKGATTTDLDSDGWSTVHYSSVDDAEIELLRSILEVEVRFLNRQENISGWTAINLSTYFGQEKVVEVLLERNPDLGIQDNDGWTPLMTAVKRNHVKIFDKLINHLTHVRADDGTSYSDDYVTQVLRRQEKGDGRTVLMELFVTGAKSISETSHAICNLLRRLDSQSANIVDYGDRTVLDYALQSAGGSDSFSADITMELLKWVPQEALLRVGQEDQTTFERAFEVPRLHQLWEIIEDRLRSDADLRENLLCRLVSQKTPKCRRMATHILSTMPCREELPDLGDKETWSLIDWAIYHRLPRVLLSCEDLQVTGTSSNENSDKAKDRGKQMIEKLRNEKKKNDVTQDVIGGTEAKKQTDITKQFGSKEEVLKTRKQNQLLGDLEDILDFTYVEQSRGVEESLEVKKPTKDTLKEWENFYAAVVGLRIDDKEFSRASKFRKVEEIIYGDSRIRTLGGTIDNLRKSGLASNEAAGPDMPDSMETRNDFTWIHLPAADMMWMMDTTKKILNQSEDLKETAKKQILSFLCASWVEVPDAVQASRFMQPRLFKMKPPNDKAPENTVSAFYMPFLIVSDCVKGNDGGCEPNLSAKSSHTGSSDPARKPFHCSPTLDEHYYHFATDPISQGDQGNRNLNQVITKYFRSHAPVGANDPSKWPLLRVSQLWAWTIQLDEAKWLVTSTSCAKTEKMSTFVKNILTHLRGRVEGSNFRQGPRSPTDLSKVIVEYCIGTYWRQLDLERFPEKRSNPEPRSPGPKTPLPPAQGRCSHTHRSSQGMTTTGRNQRSIRHIFSDYVNDIGRQEAELFRNFSEQWKKPNGVDSGIISRSQSDTRKAAELLFEIKDIRDELNILRTIAEYQRKVQSSMDDTALELLNVHNPEFDRDSNAKYVKNDIDELDRLAKNIQGSLQTTLQLHESEVANYQAGEATAQGNRIMVFTYVTVGFVPLSFLTSLFALDVETFLKTPWWCLVVIFVVPVLFFGGTMPWMQEKDPKEAPMAKKEEV